MAESTKYIPKSANLDEIYHRQYQEVLKEDDGVERAHPVYKIHYRSGFENSIADFEGAYGLGVNIAFSWGIDAKNMAIEDKNLGKDETADGNRRNVETFLNQAGFMETPRKIIKTRGKFDGLDDQILEVDEHTDKDIVIANFLFTRSRKITLEISPGGCPSAIIICKDKYGNDIVAIDHSGRQANNAGIPYQASSYLRDELGVDLSQAKVFIVPGDGRKHFFISNEEWRWPNSIVERNYGKYIDESLEGVPGAVYEKNPDSGKQRRYVDLMRATIRQFVMAGMNPDNIQFYDIDTYVAAENGESFSERLSSDRMDEHGNKFRPGRFTVAVALDSQKAA